MLDLFFFVFFATSAATSLGLLIAIRLRDHLPALRRGRKGPADV